MTTPLTVAEFHGGITDNDVDNGMHRYKRADNLIITASKHLEARDGSTIFNRIFPQAPCGLNRITAIVPIKEELIFGAIKNLYTYDELLGYSELLGPSGANSAFTIGDAAGFFSYAIWRDTLFVSYDSITVTDYTGYQSPIKIYKDDTGTWQMRSAGLPPVMGIVLTGTAGVDQYTYLVGYQYRHTVGDIQFLDAGPLTMYQFASTGEPSVNAITLTTIPVLTNAAGTHYDLEDGTGISLVIYRSQINGSTPKLLVEIDPWESLTLYAANDYVLKDGVLYICVTPNNDAVWTVGKWNLVTSYIDSAADTVVANTVDPYTVGGVLNNDTPPKCKYVHIANNIGWYGNCLDTDNLTILDNRLRQSVRNDPDSCPATAYIDFEQSIKGISSYLERIVVFCTDAIYRVDGEFDEIGGGQLTVQRISEYAGCISNSSIVQVPDGIVWAGTNGFYFTDGFTVVRLSTEFSDTYSEFTQTANQKRRISGCYDALNSLVYWTIQEETGAIHDCNKHYILDLSWGLTPQSSFTTASGGENYAPTACAVVRGKLIRGDKRGYVFQHDPDIMSDLNVDNNVGAASWTQAPIIYHYISMATSLSSSMYRKFVPRITLDMLNKSNLSLQVISNNDLSDHKVNLKPIRYRENALWGNTLDVWGNPTALWNGSALIEEQRRFNSSSLRCSYKQIEITNAHVTITSSDERGTASVTVSPAAVTLDDPNYEWPENCVGQFICFAADEYQTEYLITKRTATELLLANTVLEWVSGTTYIIDELVSYAGIVYKCIVGNSDILWVAANWEEQYTALTSGSQNWMIKGIPVNERVHLLSYTIHYSLLGKTQKMFTKAGTGNVDA